MRSFLSGLWAFFWACLPLVGATFEVRGKDFVLDGKVFQIRSGEIHYSRVPSAEWGDRIRMAKSMGLNTICTYVFWGYHEGRRGEYDFSGERDVMRFVRLCGEEGMKVIVRPGPYVCAEWDLGGLPSWLLTDEGIKLRSTDARYLGPAKEWMRKMGGMIEPLTVAKGGPVMMVQLENEFGSFGSDPEYLRQLESAIRSGGYGGLLFTSDGPLPGNLEHGGLAGMLKAVNFGEDASAAFRVLGEVAPKQPQFNAEFWVGWFDRWGVPHHRANLQRKAQDLSWMMAQGASFNLYMFHGGTTRGMWAGANFYGRYESTTCCYDYDAPLDESGRPTRNYFEMRNIISHHLKGEKLPEVPRIPEPGSIGTLSFHEYGSLASCWQEEKELRPVRSMEHYGQGNGFIVYRTQVRGPLNAVLDLSGVKDRVYVLVNGTGVAGIGGRSMAEGDVTLDLPEGNHEIGLLVENMGRLNFGRMDGERKGLEQPLKIGEREIHEWMTTLLPADSIPGVKFVSLEDSTKRAGIGLYRSRFQTPTRVDTWLDMSGFGRGVVWLNGRNLGRYWSIGPATTVFVPGVWLEKDKENELVVMELEDENCPLEVPTIRTISWDKGGARPQFESNR